MEKEGKIQKARGKRKMTKGKSKGKQEGKKRERKKKRGIKEEKIKKKEARRK